MYCIYIYIYVYVYVYGRTVSDLWLEHGETRFRLNKRRLLWSIWVEGKYSAKQQGAQCYCA